MTREEQIKRVWRVLGGELGVGGLWLAERIVDALAQPVEVTALREAAREVADAIDEEIRQCHAEDKEIDCPVCGGMYRPWRDRLRAALEAKATGG